MSGISGPGGGGGGTPSDGSVTDAKIAAGGLTNAALAAAAAIANSKLATNPLARANHTGTQTMSTISDAGTLATKSAVASADITDGTIVAADIAAAANIATSQVAKVSSTSRTGALAETFKRDGAGGAIATFAPTAGVIYLAAIELPIGMVIGHITFMSGSAAASSPSHQWFGLYNNSRVQLATTTDDTTTAWAASSEKSLAISTIASGAASTFTTTYSGLHYLGICQTAGTSVANLTALPGTVALFTLPPIVVGSADSGRTTPPAFAFTAAALTGTGNLPYAYVSA